MHAHRAREVATRRSDSPIRLETVILDTDELSEKTVTIVSQSNVATKLGLKPDGITNSTFVAGSDLPHAFANPEEQKIAEITYAVVRKLENQPEKLPLLSHLNAPEIQAVVVKAVEENYPPAQMELEGLREKLDIAAVVAKATQIIANETISIPRILVVPKGEVRSGFRSFQLKLKTLRYPPVSEDLWLQYLRTGGTEVIALEKYSTQELRLEDYVVSGLVDFDDISYDQHADLLYDLARQTVEHLKSYLSEDETRKVLSCHQREIAKFIHVQMQDHYWEDAEEYEVKVNKGYTELKESAFTGLVEDSRLDYTVAPEDKSNMSRYAFSGFKRCLFPVQKFNSDTERKLAIILDRDSLKWFKPAKGQFQIYYRIGSDHPEYQPDFVAETADAKYMIETKAKNELDDPAVLAKKEAAVSWCKNATDYETQFGGKPWSYILIPHDEVSENNTLVSLNGKYGI